MDDTTRTAASDRIDRTVAVVILHARDLDHAVDVLVAEFGFDATFCALAALDGDVRAHQAMWLCLASQAVDSGVLASGPDLAPLEIDQP